VALTKSLADQSVQGKENDNNTAFEIPISQPASKDGNKATSDAMQSVSILKTLWGDLLDEEHDMSDDEQEQNLEGELEQGSIFTPFMSRRQKTPSTVLVTKKQTNQRSQANTADSISEPGKVQVAPTPSESRLSQPLSFVSDKSVLNHVSGCAMPQPITTYHTSLSADKLPILKPPVHTVVVCSSAAQRSVEILQKFWGDYNNEEHESSLVCASAARNKKQKKQTNKQVSPKSTSSEHIQTHSKKGVIKSNPKYCD